MSSFGGLDPGQTGYHLRMVPKNAATQYSAGAG
jgi:hypothetical protein